MRNEFVAAGLLLAITSSLVFLVCHNGVIYYETDQGRAYSATNPEARRENDILVAMRPVSALLVVIGLSLAVFGLGSERVSIVQHPASRNERDRTLGQQ